MFNNGCSVDVMPCILLQIEDKVAEVLDEREKLHASWQDRNGYLDQLYDQQAFYRDARNLDTRSNLQSVSSRPPHMAYFV